MSTPSGIAQIQCLKCDRLFSLDASDIDVEESGIDEREMGAEIFYYGASDFHCPKCGNEIKVEYEASEYPVGIPNYFETNATGATLIRGFRDIDIVFHEEIYSFEEQSRLYLPEEKRILTNLASGVSALILEIDRNPKQLFQIEPREFEEIIAHIFSQRGFAVQLTKQTRDGGRDIIAIKSDDLGIHSKYIIECKRYASHRPVGVELVRSLFGVQMQEGANHSVLATTSRFTPDAMEFTKARNTTEWAMALKDYNDVVKWIRDSAKLGKA